MPSLELLLTVILFIYLFQGYYFHTENPFKDWPAPFEEGLKKLKEGDLPLTILYLEAAILQDPHDAEVSLPLVFLELVKTRLSLWVYSI